MFSKHFDTVFALVVRAGAALLMIVNDIAANQLPCCFGQLVDGHSELGRDDRDRGGSSQSV